MKLFNHVIILKKDLRDTDYLIREKVDFLEKEWKEHPTQKQYLVYYD